MKAKRRWDIWTGAGHRCCLLLFALFFIYPCVRLSLGSVLHGKNRIYAEGVRQSSSQRSTTTPRFSTASRFPAAVTVISLLLGVPFSYFFSFYKLKGRKILFVTGASVHDVRSVHRRVFAGSCCSGRSGVITKLLESIGIQHRLDLRIWRHSAGAVAEAVPAGHDLHERRISGYRRKPAGSVRESRLYGRQALFQSGYGTDRTDDSRRGADRVHACVCRLRNACADR